MDRFSVEDIEEALRTSGTGVWKLESKDGQTPCFYGNHLMNELIGISDEASPEERFTFFMSRIFPEDMPIFHEYYASLKNSEKAEVVYRYMHPDLGVIYVRCGGQQDLSVTEYRCYRGFHQNINETLRVEQEKTKLVTEKAQLYQKMSTVLMESFANAAAYIDLENGIFEWITSDGDSASTEEAYSDLCQYMSQVIPEEHRKEFLFETSMVNLRKQFKEKDKHDFSIYMYNKEGELRRITYRYYAVNEAHTKLLSISQDTTDDYRKEQKLAEALRQAQQANRAKTVFLNNMSHDMRTPMNAIIGFTNLAGKHIGDAQKSEEILGKILTSSEHLLELINDVLDMSRIESGKVDIVEDVCSLHDIVSELQTILQPDADKRKLQFEIEEIGIKHTDVYCDRLRLNQVLLNCASNSLKFTAEGGFVAIRMIEESEEEGFGNYRFEIEDTGIGMSPEFVAHIFEAFVREDDTVVRDIQGTGLGMAITKNLVDMMGGTISVESVKGEGSKFTIQLRFRIAQPKESASDTKDEESIVSLEGMQILLVEDNELNREIATEILEELGAKLDTAENGKIAVEKFEASEPNSYDLILMDCQMPIMNGYEATSAIRALDRADAATIVILAVTANAFEEDKQKAREAGMNDHVAKPLNVPVLLSTIAKYCK